MCCHNHRQRRAARRQAIAAAALAGYASTKSRYQEYRSGKQAKAIDNSNNNTPIVHEMTENDRVADGFSNVTMSEKNSASPPSYNAAIATSSPVAVAAGRDGDAKSVHSFDSASSYGSLEETTKGFLQRLREKRQAKKVLM